MVLPALTSALEVLFHDGPPQRVLERLAAGAPVNLPKVDAGALLLATEPLFGRYLDLFLLLLLLSTLYLFSLHVGLIPSRQRRGLSGFP